MEKKPNTLSSILGKRFPKTDDEIGIEIEIEGKRLGFTEALKFWTIEDDGSLRPAGGFPDSKQECVLKGPITAKWLGAAIDELQSLHSQSVLDFSFRTSTHIHLNVLDLTPAELATFLYLSYVTEGYLAHLCGDSRKGNRFCLRLQDAEGCLYGLDECLTYAFNSAAVQNINQELYRYSFMNFCALHKYGSIEFRGMVGTLDKEILSNWVGTLLSLKKAAVKIGSPTNALALFSMKDVAGVYKEIFGKDIKYPGMEEEMARNISLTLEIPAKFVSAEYLYFPQVPKKPPKGKDQFVDVRNALLQDRNLLFAHEGRNPHGFVLDDLAPRDLEQAIAIINNGARA